MAGSSLNPKMSPGLSPLPGAGIGVGYYTVNPNGGAPFTTIAEALAYRAQQGVTSGGVIFVAPGTYSDDLTIPAGVSIVGPAGAAGVAITGTVTVQGTCSLVGLAFVAAGITAIDADLGAGGGVVDIQNCIFFVSAGGTGLVASAVEVSLDGCIFQVEAATGISLIAPDVADADTGLRGSFVDMDVSSGGVGIITADGDPAGNEMVEVEINWLRQRLEDGCVGIQHDASGLAGDAEVNGFNIATYLCEGTGASNSFFRCSAGGHFIGRMVGQSIADTMFDMTGGAVIVDAIDIPRSAPKTTFRVAQIGGPSRPVLSIGSGSVHGGTTDIFRIVGGATDCILQVSNCIFSFEDDGTAINFAAGADDGQYLFTGCDFIFTGDAGGNAKFNMNGSGNPGTKRLNLTRCRVASQGAGDVIESSNIDVELVDTQLQQGNNTRDCVDMATAVLTTRFSWSGICGFSQATGGAGRALRLVSDPNLLVTEGGLLQIGGCTLAEQLELGAAAQSLVGPSGPPVQPVVQGSLATLVAGDFAIGFTGQGQPASYPGLRVVTQVDYVFLGGAGDDSTNELTFTNVQTGEGEAVAFGGANPAAGDQAGRRVALATPFLVGPGQEITAEVTTATTPSTDVRVSLG